MVQRPEDYQYSGHRAYLGQDTSGLVDTEPVLRHFGGTKARAVQVYRRFVAAGLGEASQAEYYRAIEGRLLGSEEFQKEIRHRIGDHCGLPKIIERTSVEQLLNAAVRLSGLARQAVREEQEPENSGGKRRGDHPGKGERVEQSGVSRGVRS